jgi:hypothetical protein
MAAQRNGGLGAPPAVQVEAVHRGLQNISTQRADASHWLPSRAMVQPVRISARRAVSRIQLRGRSGR